MLDKQIEMPGDHFMKFDILREELLIMHTVVLMLNVIFLAKRAC